MNQNNSHARRTTATAVRALSRIRSESRGFVIRTGSEAAVDMMARLFWNSIAPARRAIARGYRYDTGYSIITSIENSKAANRIRGPITRITMWRNDVGVAPLHALEADLDPTRRKTKTASRIGFRDAANFRFGAS
ncbi:MAG: hypothetical protein P4L85_03530 [Paludisphaera borealis]|uniref:hypothetical protein n=1 Tax=Paludisphaera borealis TaxID=1387353 RepID=UPI00284EAF7C|nr:hypothetical protein [Paludisphaera borealis]MDR3618397.1 hypothetical protein [Paludisphaera borealis]